MDTSPEVRLRGPLQDDAKKHRRNLLLVSAAAIVIVKLGLIPSEITFLGIKFDHAEQTNLRGLLFFGLVYFFIAFIVYALPDWFAWRVGIRLSQREQYQKSLEDHKNRTPTVFAEVVWGNPRQQIWMVMLSDIKAIFDLAFPLAIGLYASFLVFDRNIFNWNISELVFGVLFLVPVIIYLVVRLRNLRKKARR